jgi:hypothetical protein
MNRVTNLVVHSADDHANQNPKLGTFTMGCLVERKPKKASYPPRFFTDYPLVDIDTNGSISQNQGGTTPTVLSNNALLTY